MQRVQNGRRSLSSVLLSSRQPCLKTAFYTYILAVSVLDSSTEIGVVAGLTRRSCNMVSNLKLSKTMGSFARMAWKHYCSLRLR